MPTKDHPVTTEELPDLLHDVAYEIWMYRRSAGEVGKAANAFEHNLHVEALHLHARNLTSFFGGRLPDDNDDVVARHYVKDWATATQRDKRARAGYRWLKAEPQRRRVNKRVAHITAYRQREGKGSDGVVPSDVTEAMEPLISLFMASLSDPYRNRLEDELARLDSRPGIVSRVSASTTSTPNHLTT